MILKRGGHDFPNVIMNPTRVTLQTGLHFNDIVKLFKSSPLKQNRVYSLPSFICKPIPCMSTLPIKRQKNQEKNEEEIGKETQPQT
jgi:hypothetical protein